MYATDYLVNNRRMVKLYETMLRELCRRYGLTQIETVVVSFLNNNPEKDTAADIVELRMLSKGNVSQAVESLIQKGLLARRPDEADRRRVHLSLCAAARPVTRDIDAIGRRFQAELFKGFSEEELRQLAQMNDRIRANIYAAVERGRTQ